MVNHRRALITGAAHGIGRAVAERLATAGVDVICADIARADLDETVEAITRAGGSAVAMTLDIGDSASISGAVSALHAAGSASAPALDVLVNNAAIADVTDTRDLTMDRFRSVLDVNLLGAVDLTLGLLPMLRRSESGRIVNVASVQGLVGTRNSLSYATAKGGLLSFTRALAADLADDDVLVNALAPGFVDTRMSVGLDGVSEYDSELFKTVYQRHSGIPLRRPASAREMAEITAFLCSVDNTYITAQTIVADGGMTATFS